MASIQETLRAALGTDPALTALVEDRIFPGEIPDDEDAPPWLFYSVPESVPQDELDDGATEVRHQVEFHSLGDTYATAKAIIDAVTSVLNTFCGGQIRRAFWEGTSEDSTEEGYHHVARFTVWGTNAAIVADPASRARILTSGDRITLEAGEHVLTLDGAGLLLDGDPIGGGDAPVTSVNGQTGAVSLTAADVGADPSGAAAAVAAALGTAAVLDVAASGNAAVDQVVKGSDTRLTNARTPTAHVHSGGDITSGSVAPARLGSGTPSAGTVLTGAGAWLADPLAAPGFALVGRRYDGTLGFIRPERYVLDLNLQAAAVQANGSGAGAGTGSAGTSRGVARTVITGTTSSGAAQVRATNGGSTLYARSVMCAWVDVDALSASAEEYRVRWGWHAEWAFTPIGAEAVCFTLDRLAYGSTNWRCLTRASSTDTVTDSGIAPTPGTPQHLSIDLTDLTAVRFYLNGALVATHTTNIPAAGTETALVIRKLAGTTSREARVAGWHLWREF